MPEAAKKLKRKSEARIRLLSQPPLDWPLAIIVLILVVYATVTLVSLRSQVTQKTAEAAELTNSITAQEQENERLQDAIDNLETDEGVEAVAREKLGMVSDNEIVFRDVRN